MFNRCLNCTAVHDNLMDRCDTLQKDESMKVEQFLNRSKPYDDETSNSPVLFTVLGGAEFGSDGVAPPLDAVTRAILESSPDCVKVLDAAGRLLGMNEYGICLMELDDFAPWKHRRWSELWPSDLQPKLEDAIRIAQAGQTGRFQGACPTAKGTLRWWDVIVTPILTDGSTKQILAVSRDITDAHLSTERLRMSERHFRLLAENASDLIALHAADGSYRYASPAAERQTGYTPAQLLELRPFELVHPDDLETVRASHRAALGGENHRVEYRLHHREAGYVWLETTHRATIETSDGLEPEVQSSSRDITNRKNAERALSASEHRYRELYKAQQRFVSDASHELRAPLTSITGGLQLLERYPDLAGEEQTQILRESRAEVWRLSRLITDLLTVARGDAGVATQHETVELHTLLRRAWEAAQRLSNDHHFELVSLEPCRVMGDPDRLMQLAVALLENAVKYTLTGGSVRLSLRCTGNEVEFAVTDSGVGIPPEDLPQVFERFFRSSKARKDDPGGTGLGLAIARQIAIDHGGQLRLESMVGVGTTATATFPITRD